MPAIARVAVAGHVLREDPLHDLSCCGVDLQDP
jgi:hypothetical protein